MKLKDFLKQFESLDPELEIYNEGIDEKGIANSTCSKKSEHEYPFDRDYEIVWVKPENNPPYIGPEFKNYVLNHNEEYNKPVLIMMHL